MQRRQPVPSPNESAEIFNSADASMHELVEAVAAGDRDRVFALAKRLVSGTHAIIEQGELVCLIDERVADAIGRATKEVFTRTETTDYLRISLTTLHDLMKRGLLRPNRATGKPLFLREDLNRCSGRRSVIVGGAVAHQPAASLSGIPVDAWYAADGARMLRLPPERTALDEDGNAWAILERRQRLKIGLLALSKLILWMLVRLNGQR